MASKKAHGKSKGSAMASTAKRAARSTLRFLGSTHQAVRSDLQASTDLPTFLASAGNLTLAQRKRLVNQALVLIDDNYVHLPLKEAMHGVDPVQKLKLIKHRLDRSTTATMGSEFQFHRDMLNVFTSVRDLHTNYMLPAPFAGRVAFLPFDIKEYHDNNGPHYIATRFVDGFSHAHFRKGVEVHTWNAVPIRRAIAISANQHAGSNMEARHARGVDGLTLRSLSVALPPNAMWVIVGYTDRNGVDLEMKQDWIVAPSLPDLGGVDSGTVSLNAACLGLDIEADLRQRARVMLFAPQVIARRKKPKKVVGRKAAAGQEIASNMSEVFRAWSVTTASGEFAMIRIYTFNVNDPDEFIDEFIRLVELLPQEGLIIDVRGNGGGHIHASEGLLQVLTPRKIIPEPTQFINTPLNGRICKRHRNNPSGIDLGPWVDSIMNSVETGAIYSRGFPITPHEYANRRGQKYHGPVLLITDARCYSATDIFAAGFKDHDIGHILGVDGNTGAGGANVWDHELLRNLLRVPTPRDPDSPYETLPMQARMRVAIRRTLRVREQSGTPLEDLGVQPDSQKPLTRDDLLHGNRDLIDEAGSILSAMPVRRLTASASQAGSTLSVQATTSGISRLDIYSDGRPVASEDVGDGSHNITAQAPPGANQVRLEGFAAGNYVAARILNL